MTSMATIRFASNPKPAPVLAFGTGTALYKSDTQKSVTMALKAGFRFIDSAEIYANEESTGKGIEASGVKDDSFILTKITGGIKGDIPAVAKTQAAQLKVDVLDGFLLHYPPRGTDGNPTNVEAWKSTEKVKDSGLAKTIGVSNWLARDIKEVLDSKPKHKIDWNQIEFHPLIYHTPQMQETLKICKENNITIACYSMLVPLTKKSSIKNDKLNPVLTEIAKAKPGRSEGTVLLKWAQQRSGGVVVTTTNKEERAKEYLEAFEIGKGAEDVLSEQELSAIDEAGKASGELKVYMTPYWN